MVLLRVKPPTNSSTCDQQASLGTLVCKQQFVTRVSHTRGGCPAELFRSVRTRPALAGGTWHARLLTCAAGCAVPCCRPARGLPARGQIALHAPLPQAATPSTASSEISARNQGAAGAVGVGYLEAQGCKDTEQQPAAGRRLCGLTCQLLGRCRCRSLEPPDPDPAAGMCCLACRCKRNNVVFCKCGCHVCLNALAPDQDSRTTRSYSPVSRCSAWQAPTMRHVTLALVPLVLKAPTGVKSAVGAHACRCLSCLAELCPCANRPRCNCLHSAPPHQC